MKKSKLFRLVTILLSVALCIGVMTAMVSAQGTADPQCEPAPGPAPCKAVTAVVFDTMPVLRLYDGEAQVVDADVVDSNGKKVAEPEIVYTGVSYDGVVNNYHSSKAPSDVGVYTVTATYCGDEDYCPSAGVNTLVIYPDIDPSFVLFEKNPVVVEYDGQPHSMVAHVYNMAFKHIDEPDMMVYYSVDENGKVTASLKAPVEPGEYYVLAIFFGNKDYAPSANIGKLIIKPVQEPECPTEPEVTEPEVTEPEETEPSEPVADPTNPTTGDDFNMMLFVSLLAISAAGFAVVCFILFTDKKINF